jgi:heme-degrading monooxygenase HmoA
MVPSDVPLPTPGLVVVSRHRVGLDEAKAALVVLARQHGCLSSTIARSTDDYDLLVIVTEWDSVRSYRKALSSYEVKVESVPLLATAFDETTAFEVLYRQDATGVIEREGALVEKPQRIPD